MAKEYSDFRGSVLGKKIDYDGFPPSQPYQCVDLANAEVLYVGSPKRIHCGATGYAKDFATQKESNGILDYYDDIGLNTDMQSGDLCVWDNCPQCPNSHVAVYDHDNGQSEVYFLGQNQPYPYVNISRISVRGIIGVFRPKIWADGNKDTDGYQPTPDQMLTIGSKVVSNTFTIEGVAVKNGKWCGYSRIVGGWFPLEDVDEVNSVDGNLDQIVHTGSGCQFNKGVMTVTRFEGGNIVRVDALSYPINADCLVEIEV
jgi:hypothetical protein